MKVFFSYTVRDGLVSRSVLRRIARGLENFCSPYIDLLHHRTGGHQPSVWSALDSADALFLCVSPRVYCSPWVRVELSIAKRHGIPIYTGLLEMWLATHHPETRLVTRNKVTGANSRPGFPFLGGRAFYERGVLGASRSGGCRSGLVVRPLAS